MAQQKAGILASMNEKPRKRQGMVGGSRVVCAAAPVLLAAIYFGSYCLCLVQGVHTVYPTGTVVDGKFLPGPEGPIICARAIARSMLSADSGHAIFSGPLTVFIGLWIGSSDDHASPQAAVPVRAGETFLGDCRRGLPLPARHHGMGQDTVGYGDQCKPAAHYDYGCCLGVGATDRPPTTNTLTLPRNTIFGTSARFLEPGRFLMQSPLLRPVLGS